MHAYLADYLAKVGLPFREAHEVVGKIVRHCIESGSTLETLDAATISTFSPLLAEDPETALAQLTVKASVAKRTSRGGSAPDAVRAQWGIANARIVGP